MINTRCLIFLGLLGAFVAPAFAQSFRVQCPESTITHPTAPDAEPAYSGPTPLTCSVAGGCIPTNNKGYLVPATGANVNGAIKCQQISGGDGYATMGDGTQTYLFSFGPLSGLTDISNGSWGTEVPSVFNVPYTGASPLVPGDPATSGIAVYNGAVGLTNNVAFIETVYDASEGCNTAILPNCTPTNTPSTTVTIVLNTVVPFASGDQVVISNVGGGYDGTWKITQVGVANAFFNSGPGPGGGVPDGANYAFQFTATSTGLGEVAQPASGTASSVPGLDGHVDPRQIMDVGVMNGNIPAPLMAIDEDDEFFLTLTNVGMIMRPDLFEQHTVHFHGYPNASSFYDGVPDASVAINIGGSFTYYYLAPDAGTYFWHCHITPPEHLQMGMVGQLFVRPRQNRVPAGIGLYSSLQTQQNDLRTACRRVGDGASPALSAQTGADVLCSNPVPAVTNAVTQPTGGRKYAYNDGDGSTGYDVEYALQMHAFDPNFHFVGMTFNPEGFADMKDKYFLLNGRSYPDTVADGPMKTPSSDGVYHFSQPLGSIINIPAGGKALLRISELDVSEYHTLASLGIPMHVVGLNAKLLRDQAGNNLDYYTNSITLGGGESVDVILDASDTSKYHSNQVFYLYTSNLDHLSNDAENFGGQMTEVRIN